MMYKKIISLTESELLCNEYYYKLYNKNGRGGGGGGGVGALQIRIRYRRQSII